jgi:hypothetical protein
MPQATTDALHARRGGFSAAKVLALRLGATQHSPFGNYWLALARLVSRWPGITAELQLQSQGSIQKMRSDGQARDLLAVSAPAKSCTRGVECGSVEVEVEVEVEGRPDSRVVMAVRGSCSGARSQESGAGPCVLSSRSYCTISTVALP